MPKLGQYQFLLDATFFLYQSKDDALRGSRFGGTGFLLGLRSERFPDRAYLFGVTNWHVACQSAASVIRLNRRDGGCDIFELDPSNWLWIPGGPDVAIVPLHADPAVHKIAPIAANDWLATSDRIKDFDIGPGDDVFMIGRFIDYDGTETNIPAMRFGNISIMSAKVRQRTGHMGPSVVADMHSRTGFSGSPVFVFRTVGSEFLNFDPKNPSLLVPNHMIFLLGIHWGQFQEKISLKDGPISQDAEEGASLITDGKYVEGLSGMTCIVPASEIAEIFKTQAFRQMWAQAEDSSGA